MESTNKYQKWIHPAKAVDSWRISQDYHYNLYRLLYKVVIWYMAIPSSTMEQRVWLVSVGAGAAWFGLYTGSKNAKKLT